MKYMELIAPCHFGMEAVLKREILDLGYEISKVEDGKVTFLADADGIAQANMFLRTTERILLKTGEFKAVTFDELFEKTKAIPWEDYIPKDGKFWVAKANSVKSALFSPSDIQSIMKKAIVGKKIGMTQVFTDDGRLVPVTVVEAGPCKVVQKKTTESDGYDAVQVGYDTYAENRAKKLVNKPLTGHFKKAGVAPTRYLREFRLDNVAELEVGNELTVSQFEAGEKIDVSGVSKGHGFTGAIQRWNQHTGPMAHGSKYHRGVGSMSANSDPSRVFKNKHMPGHYGVERVTIQNLEIVRVDAERNLLLIKGAVPGPNGGLLLVRNTCKA